MAELLSNEEKIFNEKLRNSLRKLIKSLNLIREADDFEELKDNLKHMEETDENFHKYELVEMLTERIEKSLGTSIDNHVNEAFSKCNVDSDIVQNKKAETIYNEILKTKEFTELKNAFKTSTIKANDYLMKNFHSSFIEMTSDDNAINENESKSVAFTYDFDFMSPDNSLNQNSFVFYTSEQFPIIGQNLDPKKSDQVRLRAIQQLLSIPASDPQAADHWVEIRKFLNYALKDQNEKISELCLKLHSRTLASSHYKVSLEIYINLIEHLMEYFKDKELDKRQFKSNIDLNTKENSFLLKIFRLINDYARDITNKWARYPDTFIESIINHTLKLFCIINDQKISQYMSPIHFIALLDTHSNWFLKWMHGHDSRKVLIDSIKTHESFLQIAIASINSYMNTYNKRQEGNGSGHQARKKSNSTSADTKRVIFKKAEIEYVHFIHSLNIVGKILFFKNGRNLFPIKAFQSNNFTLKEMIKIIIQIISEESLVKSSNDFLPSNYAYDILQTLCVCEETCNACLCNEEAVEQLIKPLKTIIQIKKANTSSSTSLAQSSNQNLMLYIANVLSKMATTVCGYRYLLYGDAKKNFSTNTTKNTAAHTIAVFVQKALANQLNYPISTIEIAEYLYLIRLLYSQAQGVFLIKQYQLNSSIADAWRIARKDDNGKLSTDSDANLLEADTMLNETSKFSLAESLLDNLLSLSSTPKGVYYLNETGLLSHVINYMFTRYKSKLQVGKYEKFGYGFIISQLSNAPMSCYYLNEASFIQYLIDDIWTELEYGSDDFMSAFPRAYSVDAIDREVYKPMLCLINILSSFPSVYELLADVNSTPRSHYDMRDTPKGLIGLLDRVVFLDRKLKIKSLCNYEQSHTFGLRLLNYLQSDLDVLLLMESQYNTSELMLHLQNANKASKSQLDLNCADQDEQDNDMDETENLVEDLNDQRNIMIDIFSVERNMVLVNANVIGGPSEKLLPTRHVNEIKNPDYPFVLFDKLPIPDMYLKKNDLKYKKDQALSEFLSEFKYDQIVQSEEHVSQWLDKYQALFQNAIKSINLDLESMIAGLNQFVRIQSASSMNRKISDLSSKDAKEFKAKTSDLVNSIGISKLQKLGVEKTIQYGNQLSLYPKSTKREEKIHDLCETHKFVKALLKQSNKTKKPNENQILNYSQEEFYPSYDWFTSSIFLFHKGDYDSTINFLYNFHFLETSAFLWPVRLFANQHLLPTVYTRNGINILLSTTCHYIEFILKIEEPVIFSAFRMSGLAPSQICLHWLKQCFWNYLDWSDIVVYLSICIVFGIDYQTYFCLALLKHLNQKLLMNNTSQKIMQHHTDKDLQFFLKENQIENFKIQSHFDFMLEMEKKYRKYIFADLKDIWN